MSYEVTEMMTQTGTHNQGTIMTEASSMVGALLAGALPHAAHYCVNEVQ